MSGKVIAVANQKGGTGKTATTLSLGVALARHGKKILLVDTDPQGDLTKSLGWRDPDSMEITIGNHLEAAIFDQDLDGHVGILNHDEGVDLMPANIRLADIETGLFMAMDRESVLKDWIEPLKDEYDYILIDCMPTLGIIPINVFVAADSVIIPVSAEYLPAVGMTGLIKSINKVRKKLNKNLNVEGILLTLFDRRTKLAREIEDTVRNDYGQMFPVFETKIPRAVSAAESSATGTSIFSYDGKGRAAKAYNDLASEVIAHG